MKKEEAKMKKFVVLYRGKKVDEIMAEDNWKATVEADRRGYSITMVEIRESK